MPVGVTALLDLPLGVKLPVLPGSNNLYYTTKLNKKVIFVLILVDFANFYLLLKSGATLYKLH